jgi:hypothetical protein
VRLACVKHAASVHSEPGSNSPIELSNAVWVTASFFSDPTHPNPLFSFQRSNVRHDRDGECFFVRTEMHPQKRQI